MIDGNSIAYRAFFALPLLNNDKGVYTNAVYGFTTMLLKVIEEEKPTHLLVAFDAGKTTFRHKTFQEYKGGRQKTPPELSEQFPLIRELLDAFNVKRYEIENYEADDIIGTLAKEVSEQEDWEVKIYSGDKDLLQLVSEKVTVALTRKGISNVDTYDETFVLEKYGINPKQIIDMKGLMGDPSDNIPGVPGIGEKTAIKLLKEFGSVEKLLESIDLVSGKKLKENLTENKEKAVMSKELATIYCEVPITIPRDELVFGEYDEQKVISLFKELDFQSLLDRFDFDETELVEEIEALDFTIANEITDEMLTKESAIVVEVLDENYHQADIIGLAIVNENGRYYIPTEMAIASDTFKEWAKDKEAKKAIFDAKRAVVALGWKGIELEGINFDLLIASYILDPSASSHEVADIANRKGKRIVSLDEAIYGKGAKRSIPDRDIVAEHLVKKANTVYTLREEVCEELTANQLNELFYDLEMPLTIILGKMEMTGVKVDVEQLRLMGEDLGEQLKNLEKEIHSLAGIEFNINSPKQLGEVLFEKLNLPVLKKTKTGASTSADVLEKLADKHEVIPSILHYRQLGKLNSTYIEGLLKVVHQDTAKIHTMFNQALTQTGRLSSTEPNLQNIPIRLEEGRKIRKAFIPSSPDWIIFAADYSQIELRVLAHIANDETLIDAFNNGMDIHTRTAMDVFHVEKDAVTDLMRRHAKAVNFGIVYGISDYGLSQSLGITRKEAGSFIERYLESFPGVRDYMDNIVQEAREKGFVTTLLHRRRFLPEITSRNFNLRSFAERTAMNTPIQGTAADIIKKAMVNIALRIEAEGLEAKLLLQVHDELIFEAPKQELDKLKLIVPEVMESAIDLKVPLKVEYAYGSSWYDAK
ncbi:DNA polymerase I [Anaerobacillus alkaliphilus]|uniref:DNA polymerase I n=1 Tax=Anaerobacillus alkaliphilus TaxID=1548597 RepID=A0A4Q0VTH1_9BACI|nr:DNA polymerase I [Anaerobacillus alkaliphilus]RXI98750.1 DNA polymerase I [Anaerobacillus alkaliphilus]